MYIRMRSVSVASDKSEFHLPHFRVGNILRVPYHTPVRDRLQPRIVLVVRNTQYITNTENSEMGKVKLRFIRGYANATYADLTQVKNVPL